MRDSPRPNTLQNPLGDVADSQEMQKSLEPPRAPPNLVPWRECGERGRHLCWPLRKKQVS